MGISFVSESQSQTLIQPNMKFLIALCLVASAMAIEDTAEVAAAKADFAAAFTAAEAGEHAALAPAAVASAYLDDTADVAAAKAAFAAAFDSAEKIAALPAPYFYNGYYGGYPYAHGAYPYAAYAHGAYPYAAYAHGAYAYGAYPYAGYGYAGYPYVLPAAPAKEE